MQIIYIMKPNNSLDLLSLSFQVISHAYYALNIIKIVLVKYFSPICSLIHYQFSVQSTTFVEICNQPLNCISWSGSHVINPPKVVVCDFVKCLQDLSPIFCLYGHCLTRNTAKKEKNLRELSQPQERFEKSFFRSSFIFLKIFPIIFWGSSYFFSFSF